MKKYQIAWVGIPNEAEVCLGSSDPNLIKWFLEKLKAIAPNFKFFDRYSGFPYLDLGGNQNECVVHHLNGKDGAINYWLIQELLKIGWEPFSVTSSDRRNYIYLRKELTEET